MNAKNCFLATVLLIAAIALTASTVHSQQPQPGQKKSIFSSLKVGQVVALREKGTSWEVSTMDVPNAGTHKIVEVHDDFIVVLDIADVIETRISVYSVRAVVHLKTKAK